MPPFKFPVCPNCKKKNEIDLAKLSTSDIGYRSTEKSKKRDFFIPCKYCHEPFKFTVEEEKPDEIKKR